MRRDFYFGDLENVWMESKWVTNLVTFLYDTLPEITNVVTKADFCLDHNSWSFLQLKYRSFRINYEGDSLSIDHILDTDNVLKYTLSKNIMNSISAVQYDLERQLKDVIHRRKDREPIVKNLDRVYRRIRNGRQMQAFDDLSTLAKSKIKDKATLLYVIEKIIQKYP